MSRTTDRATIRSKIRVVADRPSTVRPTDAQLNTLIDEAWTHLWDIITRQSPMRYVKQADVTITSGTRSYSLPSDFKQMVGVAVQDTSKPDGYDILEKYDWDERYDYTYQQEKYYTKYNVQNGEIWFHPTPSWNGVIRLEYVPVAATWTDSTSIDTVNGWDKWIIYQVSADLMGLDHEDPSYFVGMRQDIEARILVSNELDVGKPKTVVDVRRGSKIYPWFRR